MGLRFGEAAAKADVCSMIVSCLRCGRSTGEGSVRGTLMPFLGGWLEDVKAKRPLSRLEVMQGRWKPRSRRVFGALAEMRSDLRPPAAASDGYATIWLPMLKALRFLL